MACLNHIHHRTIVTEDVPVLLATKWDLYAFSLSLWYKTFRKLCLDKENYSPLQVFSLAVVSMNNPTITMRLTSSTETYLFRCPNEIILQILRNVSPYDQLSFSKVSKRCSVLAKDPLLWMSYCTKFKYWPANVLEAMRYNDLSADWMNTALDHERVNELVKKQFEKLMTSDKPTRNQLLGELRFGYFAKDFLMKQRFAPDDCPKIICRRYLAQKALNSVHRGLVIDEWARVIHFKQPFSTQAWTGYNKYRLESLLCNLGLAILQQPEEHVESLPARLDHLADVFRKAHPGCLQGLISERTTLLLKWFHQRTVDMRNGEPHRYLLSYVGHAPFGQGLKILTSSGTDTVRKFLAIIFVTLAQRLNLPAYFSCNGNSIIVPQVDDNSCSDSHWAEHIIVRPGVSNSYKVLAGKPDTIQIQVMTEDEFVLSLLSSFRECLEVNIDTLDLLGQQFYCAANKMESCGRLFLGTLLSKRTLIHTIHRSALWGTPPDLNAMEHHLQDWLVNNTPQHVADRTTAYKLLTELRNVASKKAHSPVIPRCIAGCDGHGCPQCPRFQIGDIVSVPSFYVDILPEKPPVAVVVQVVIHMASEPACYNYHLMFAAPVGEHALSLGYTATQGVLRVCHEWDLARVNDPGRIEKDLFFSAGYSFESFDTQNCRFIPNSNIYVSCEEEN